MRIPVSVTTTSGDQQACYTYVVKDDKEDSLPSKRYLDILIEGAEEHGLPSDYIATLKSLPHNGYAGEVNPPWDSVALERDMILVKSTNQLPDLNPLTH